MGLVDSDDCRLVLVFVGERDLNLLRVVDDVIVGENVSLFVENEAGTLALLGYGAIEEVERHCGREDVDDRGQCLFVHGDVLLLLSVVGGSGVGFGQLEASHRTLNRCSVCIGSGCGNRGSRTMHPRRKRTRRSDVSGHVIEGGKNKDNKKNGTQFH